MDVFKHNQRAWDTLVERGFEWTVPGLSGGCESGQARPVGDRLDPSSTSPPRAVPPLAGTRTLCLAGAGGQQGPVLAAAGAKVTVFDASPRQLAQDRLVAERESLSIETIQGDMKDLRVFDDESFDLVVHPCSNCFVPDVAPVWGEIFRISRPAACSFRALSIRPSTSSMMLLRKGRSPCSSPVALLGPGESDGGGATEPSFAQRSRSSSATRSKISLVARRELALRSWDCTKTNGPATRYPSSWPRWLQLVL